LKLLKIILIWGLGLLTLITVAVFWLMSQGYNIYLPPPAENQKIEHLLLTEFQGHTAHIEKLQLDASKYNGFKAHYGSQASITIIKATSIEMSNDYFKTVLVPIVKTYKKHSRGIFKGRWIAKGTAESGARWFAWTNQHWVFILQADNKQTLDSIVNIFPYIN